MGTFSGKDYMMVDTAKDMISTRSILPCSFLPFWDSRGKKLIKWYSLQGFVYEIYSSRDIRWTLLRKFYIRLALHQAQGILLQGQWLLQSIFCQRHNFLPWKSIHKWHPARTMLTIQNTQLQTTLTMLDSLLGTFWSHWDIIITRSICRTHWALKKGQTKQKNYSAKDMHNKLCQGHTNVTVKI